jgi:hypothetical protein
VLRGRIALNQVKSLNCKIRYLAEHLQTQAQAPELAVRLYEQPLPDSFLRASRKLVTALIALVCLFFKLKLPTYHEDNGAGIEQVFQLKTKNKYIKNYGLYTTKKIHYPLSSLLSPPLPLPLKENKYLQFHAIKQHHCSI